MEIEEIQQIIKRNGGYISLTALKEAFKDDNQEIHDMKLTFLVEKRKVRTARFQSPDGPDTLYYCPVE